MKKETKTLYILAGVLVLALVGSLAFVLRPQQKSQLTATIQVGSQIIREISLDTAADEEFSIMDETGLPITFAIKDHTIRFLDSNCPDKICVNAGFMARDMDIASCLPNKTVLIVSAAK